MTSADPLPSVDTIGATSSIDVVLVSAATSSDHTRSGAGCQTIAPPVTAATRASTGHGDVVHDLERPRIDDRERRQRAVVAEHDAVGLLDIELGARAGDVDDPGHLADGPVQVTGQPVGTAHEPGPAVVGVGAHRRAPVGLDGRDEDPADDGNHSHRGAEFAQSARGHGSL